MNAMDADDGASDPPPPRWKRLVNRLQVAEWVVALVVGGVPLLLAELLSPYCQPFRWDDPTIAHPLKPNTFPDYSLVLISAAPVLVYALWTRVWPALPHGLWLDEVNTLALMQARAYALLSLMLNPCKLYAGRLRPDFLARLEHAGYSAASRGVDWCSVDDAAVVLGRKSFPSGHSGTSFAAMVPLTLFLCVELRALSRGSLALLVVAVSPLALAFVCGISRHRDEWHHFSDIVAGAVMGVAAGAAAFRLSTQVVVTDGGVRRPVPFHRHLIDDDRLPAYGDNMIDTQNTSLH